ncbi:hypothetical protein JW978_00955 [Candidatus Dojkabacteria bacterium]|nr:hypothetical protein [Candidatus Dojkabacteria bacterium]
MAGHDLRASSERIVSSKVVRKAGPLGKIGGFFGDLSKSITGMVGGCVMLVIGFGIIIAGVVAVSDDSKTIEKLDLLSIEEAGDKDELVKVEGSAVLSSQASLEYIVKDAYGVQTPYIFDKEALYLEVEYQMYEQVKQTSESTETVTDENGDQIEQTSEKTDIYEEWVTKETTQTFGEFSLGDIALDTTDIGKRFDMQTEIITDVVIPGAGAPQIYENPSAQVGDTKMIVSYVPASDDLIVIGNIHNKKIDGGDVFMISNLSDTELVSKLQGEESAMRWGLRFVAWLLLTLGFSALVAPVLVLTKLVPGLNKIIGCVTTIVFGVVSAIIVALITLLVTYWWLVILCSVMLVGGVVGLAVMSMGKKK